jgi:DNA polymerase III alpha subunit (gram-positive type)
MSEEFIIFDLETTGLKTDGTDDVIGAWIGDSSVFNIYLTV